MDALAGITGLVNEVSAPLEWIKNYTFQILDAWANGYPDTTSMYKRYARNSAMVSAVLFILLLVDEEVNHAEEEKKARETHTPIKNPTTFVNRLTGAAIGGAVSGTCMTTYAMFTWYRHKALTKMIGQSMLPVVGWTAGISTVVFAGLFHKGKITTVITRAAVLGTLFTLILDSTVFPFVRRGKERKTMRALQTLFKTPGCETLESAMTCQDAKADLIGVMDKSMPGFVKNFIQQKAGLNNVFTALIAKEYVEDAANVAKDFLEVQNM